MTSVYYREVQKMKQWWLWIVCGAALPDLTQLQLAEDTGVTRQTISLIEKGKYKKKRTDDDEVD
jgi:transcriptional regulator with XRE-family HTH domain